MTTIALFHSVLGVRPGVHAAADLLRSHGHAVRIVDQYEGRVFDDYGEADGFATSIGYPALMQRAVDAVADLAEPFVCAGFSNGGGMSEHVACQNERVRGAVLFSGALDPAVIGITAWPARVPVQIHYTRDDPFRRNEWIDALEALVARSGAAVERCDYDGHGHLFTDPSLPDEYDADAAAELWLRTLRFLGDIERGC